MSLANELQKLKSLRDSGGITAAEYEKLRNRLLEECVRHIEAVHDLNPKACVTGEPGAVQRGDGEPRVKFPQMDTRPEGNRQSYSGELDYSLVRPPVQRVADSSPAASSVTEAQARSSGSVPCSDQKQGLSDSAPSQSTRPLEAFKRQAAAATALATPGGRPAESTVKIIPPPARVTEERPAQPSWGGAAQRVEVSFSSRGAVLDVKQPARHIEVFEKEEAAPGAVAPAQRTAGAPVKILSSPLHNEADSGPEKLPAEVSSASQALESNDRSNEERVPRFAFHESKPSGRDRWGLPRFKLVRGVVQDVRASICPDSERYAASIEVDGQRMAITSASEIRIAAGDRISLGGYERDGELLVLAYRNETNGSYSDLSSLRQRYRFLLTAGRLSLMIGLSVLAATLMFLLHTPAWASHFNKWGYVPYVLSGLVAAAVSYLGLTLSFVGKWAKEFHNALAPADSSSEPGAYNPSSLPLALQ